MYDNQQQKKGDYSAKKINSRIEAVPSAHLRLEERGELDDADDVGRHGLRRHGSRGDGRQRRHGHQTTQAVVAPSQEQQQRSSR